MEQITTNQYAAFETAYDWFNADLFNGRLPAVLITLQRKSKAMGYFSSGRFASRNGEGTTDELALNPATFRGRTDLEILSTLVHEMCHVWQYHFGKVSRSGYHNGEWADKMTSIGLEPSSTGKPDGKRTGQKMSGYIIPGPFETSAKGLLLTGFRLNWESPDGKKKSSQSKSKFTCPDCRLNAWAKPTASLACFDCTVRMVKDE